MNDMIHMRNNPSKYRYGQKECCIIKSNGEGRWYTLIMLTNLNTMESVVSEYSEYFFKDKNMIKGAIATKKNNYGDKIVSFLNYIFFDRDEPLESIEDISKEIGEEYLNKYSVGELKDIRTKEGYTVSNAPDTVVKAKSALTYFYYWLYSKHEEKPVKRQRLKQYNLKYIFESDFNWREVKTVAGKKIVLDNIFLNVETYLKDRIWKLENPSDLVVFELIEIARDIDPMIGFALALQACVGIRRGEACQMHKDRFVFNVTSGAVRSLYVNMETEKLLRDDGVRTGHIKRKRCQLAYPAFDSYLYKMYDEHLRFLKSEGLDNDPYGAIFFGENRKAMTTKTYARRFIRLIPVLIERLSEKKNQGDLEAALDYDKLVTQKMTPHAFRKFFTEYVANHESSAHTVAMYRGDNTLQAALAYLRQSESKRKEIKAIQDSFAKNYEKKTGRKISF